MTQDGATEQSEQKGRHEKGTEARPPKTTVKGHRKRERDNLLGTCWGNEAEADEEQRAR